MDTVTVSPKYQIVIPNRIRERIGIHPGEKVTVIEKDGVIHIIRMEGIKKLRGRFKKLSSEGLRDEGDRY